MEYNSRGVHPHSSYPPYNPPPTNYSSFSTQTLRINYPNNPNSIGMYNPPLPRNPNEALIRRQMEKEKIREEILANEAWSRRELEAEVRRELMMEREMQFRRNASHFPFRHGPPALPYPPPPSWGGGGGGFAGAYSSGLGGFDKEMPFQRIAPQIKPMKTEGKAETEKQNANDRLIFLDKADGNHSGTKRKMATPPTVGAGFLPLIGCKKPKEEWSCALCQVHATTEQGLNEHLRGKRHKSKEAKLKAQRTGKNYSIGLCSKTSKPTKLATKNPIAEQVGETEGKSLRFIKEGDSSSLHIQKSGDATIQQKEEDTPDSKEIVDTAQKMQKILEKKKKFKFWCEMCQMGTFSQKVMNNHKKGKKHVSRLKELNRKVEAVPDTQVVKAVEGE